jgi:citrate lyase subunit beta/citryl-CoA lyase
MRLRSLLFVPGDRPERFSKAEASGADAVIFDLEDSVAEGRKQFARAAVAEYLASSSSRVVRLVRVNPVVSPWLKADLAVAARAQGLVLPKAEGLETFSVLDSKAEVSLPPILPIATETPVAMFRLGDYARLGRRLMGLTWGAEDLPAAIGAASGRNLQGELTGPYEMARNLTLFAAHAAKVAAIETVYPDIRNLEGLRAYAERGAYDGFNGMMAIHPLQVAVINRAFSPTELDLEHARAIVAAFAAAPDQGALQFEGRMIDAPHLTHARRVLEQES